jgi:phage gp46-like protein
MSANSFITFYEGDPKVFIEEDGSYLRWQGGQPLMDAGWENAIILSLFTTMKPHNSKLGWFGNHFVEERFRLGSRFEEAMGLPVVPSNLFEAEQAAEQALEWMLDSGYASEVIAAVSAPRTDTKEALVRVTRPDLTVQELLLLRNGINWIFQKEDPAFRRA